MSAMNQHARARSRSDPVHRRRRAAPPARHARSTTRSRACSTHCQFILGPEVAAFEAELAAFCGAKHAVSCASGTDALVLVLMAKGIGPGDAVICPSFTFCATAEVVALVGATPVFADVDADDVQPRCRKPRSARSRPRSGTGLKPKAVIPVDLFGLPADHDAIAAVAKAEGLFVLDDAAQGFGATYKGRKLGTLGARDRDQLLPGQAARLLRRRRRGADRRRRAASNVLKSLRVHGQGTDKYDNVRIGMTSRLDTIQAAVLIEKLKIFPDEIEARDRGRAPLHRRRWAMSRSCRACPTGYTSVWAQYTIRLEARRARRARRRAEGAGHPDRDLLSEAAAPAGGLSGISRWPTAACR